MSGNGDRMECVPPEEIVFDIVLVEPGTDRVALMKLIREHRPDLGPVAVKRMIESAPATVLEHIQLFEARAIVRALWALGASVRLAGAFAEDSRALERVMWPDGVISPGWR